MTPDQRLHAQQQAHEYLAQFVAVTKEEVGRLEVVDFGLGDFDQFGLVILTYVNTERCCAKEMILREGQVCAEHLHPPFEGHVGKEETFRVRSGTVYLYTEGAPTEAPRCQPDRQQHFTAWHEIRLEAGNSTRCHPRPSTGSRRSTGPPWCQSSPPRAVTSTTSSPTPTSCALRKRVHR